MIYWMGRMKTKCRIVTFLLFFVGVTFCCNAQEKGFLTTYSEPDHSWFVTDAIETSDGGFLVSAYDYWGPSSMLLKLSAEGEIVVKRSVMAEDTTIHAYRFLQIPEDNRDEYMALCPSHPADGSTAALMLLHVDEDLNIVSRRTIPCSFFDEGSRFFDAKFLKSDSSFYAALTSRLDTEEECSYSIWCMKSYVVKDVKEQQVDYYLDEDVANGNYDFAFKEGDVYYVADFVGDSLSIHEIDSLDYGCRPQFAFVCKSRNCEDNCTKGGDWYNAWCHACPLSNGDCEEVGMISHLLSYLNFF